MEEGIAACFTAYIYTACSKTASKASSFPPDRVIEAEVVNGVRAGLQLFWLSSTVLDEMVVRNYGMVCSKEMRGTGRVCTPRNEGQNPFAPFRLIP